MGSQISCEILPRFPYFPCMKGIVGAILLCGMAAAQPNWLQLVPATIPPGREAGVMVYDGARKQMVMFGGEIASGFANDTWVWDGVNWTSKSPAASPAATDCYSTFAFDETHQQAILVLQGPSSNVPP